MDPADKPRDVGNGVISYNKSKGTGMIDLSTVLNVLQSNRSNDGQHDRMENGADDFLLLLPAMLAGNQPNVADKSLPADEMEQLQEPDIFIDTENSDETEGSVSTDWFDLDGFIPPGTESELREDFPVSEGVESENEIEKEPESRIENGSEVIVNAATVDEVLIDDAFITQPVNTSEAVWETLDEKEVELTTTPELDPEIDRDTLAEFEQQTPISFNMPVLQNPDTTDAEVVPSPSSEQVSIVTDPLKKMDNSKRLDNEVILQQALKTDLKPSESISPAPTVKTEFSEGAPLLTARGGGERLQVVLPELMSAPTQDSMPAQMHASYPDTAGLTDTRIQSAFRQLDLPQNVQHKDWGDHFNQQIVWLGQQKIKSAVLRLNPQDLGPLEVNIKMLKDGASLHISTHSIQVQDQIEQSLPRLREMLASQGLQLDQVNIEQRNAQSERQGSPQTGRLTDKTALEGEVPTEDISTYTTKGLVDYFA